MYVVKVRGQYVRDEVVKNRLKMWTPLLSQAKRFNNLSGSQQSVQAWCDMNLDSRETVQVTTDDGPTIEWQFKVGESWRGYAANY